MSAIDPLLLMAMGPTSALSITGTLSTPHGGTGTSTTFTAGSVVFAGTSGIYAQDNANFFWDDTSNFLRIGSGADVLGITSRSSKNHFGRVAQQTSGQEIFVVGQDDAADSSAANANAITLRLDHAAAAGSPTANIIIDFRRNDDAAQLRAGQMVFTKGAAANGVAFDLTLADSGATQRNRISMITTATIFNEDAQDFDFRIEGTTDANLLYVDAGNNRVGIGAASPSNKFDVVINTAAGVVSAVRNTLNNASSQALFLAEVAGATSGDVYTRYSISGVTDWATGADNDAADAYVISQGSTLGTNNRLSIATGGAITIPNLAGVGTRTVVADANGVLSAP